MDSIALEIKLECKTCGNSIAMNALNKEFECKSCFEFANFSHGALVENFKEIIKRVVEQNDNRLKVTGSVIPFYLEGVQCTRLYGRKFPFYGGEQIDMEMIEKNVDAGFVMMNEQKVLIRKLPSAFAKNLEQVKYLIGEDEEQANHLPGDSRTKLPGAEPILFSCLSCGGALTIDGTARVVECKYCKSSSYIPDGLWLKFHPISRVERWYMVW